MRDWNGYISSNRTEGDCQLVTAVNAYYYLTGKTVSEKRYEKFVDVAKCRHGSAISIGDVWKKLGIREEKRYCHIFCTIEKGKRFLPLEINVWHKCFGFHSVLAVEWEWRTEALRVTNFRRVVSNTGWIFLEDLHHFVIDNPDKGEPRWQCRKLGLYNPR
jgi:hypothetical protein